jgi:hypothetical protein
LPCFSSFFLSARQGSSTHFGNICNFWSSHIDTIGRLDHFVKTTFKLTPGQLELPGMEKK